MSRKANSTSKLVTGQGRSADEAYRFGDAYASIGGHIQWVIERWLFFLDWERRPKKPQLFLQHAANSIEHRACDVMLDITNRLGEAIESGNGQFFKDIGEAIEVHHKHSGDSFSSYADPIRGFIRMFFYDCHGTGRLKPGKTIRECKRLLAKRFAKRFTNHKDSDRHMRRLFRELNIPEGKAGRPRGKTGAK